MIPKNRLLHLVAVTTVAIAPVHAATYDQIVFNPTPSTWNTPLMWSSNPDPVSAGNDYQTAGDPTRLVENNPYETTFTVDVGGIVTAWQIYGTVRDHGGTGLPTTDSTFNGDRLLIGNQTRFISKARTTTTTANFVLQNGGMMFLAPGGASSDGVGTATWAGTISTSGNTLIGIGTSGNTNSTTLNITAPITGSGVLTLTGKGDQAAALQINGDISAFAGTFLLTSVTAKTAVPIVFSIANSAPMATLQLNIDSPLFMYNLGTDETDVTFGAMIVGDTVLGEGVYDALWLNDTFGNGTQFMGDGSITVVPEPGTLALLALGGGFAAIAGIRRRRALAA